MCKGSILKSEAVKHEVKLKQVAKELGMNKWSLSEYLNGDRDLTPTIAANIREAIYRIAERRTQNARF